MNLRKLIQNVVRETLKENKVYDEYLALRRWYEEEREKISREDNPYNIFKIKTKRLEDLYRNKERELDLEKYDDPYAFSGNIDAKNLYHYTNGYALERIIKDNLLYGDYRGISFTTNPNLYKRGFVFYHTNEYGEGRHSGNVGVKIKFDFDKMKKDGFNFKKGSEYMGTHGGEEEIRLRMDIFENPIKYIKEIIILKDKEKNYESLSELLNSKNISNKVV